MANTGAGAVECGPGALHQRLDACSGRLCGGAGIQPFGKGLSDLNRDSSDWASSDLRHVLGERFFAVGNRRRVGEAYRDDRHAKRADGGEGARMKLVNRITRKRPPFGEGHHHASLFDPTPNLTKRGRAAPAVFAVDEDRAPVLCETTEQWPLGDVMPTHQHSAKHGEHDADVERALMVCDDQRPVVQIGLPVDEQLGAEEPENSVGETVAIARQQLGVGVCRGQGPLRFVGR